MYLTKTKMVDALRPFEEDTNTGTAKFVGCWIFTVIVGIALIFRYAAKAWVHWALPCVFALERDWAVEDVLLLISYPIDVMHMTAVELGSHWGLGRHYNHLDPLEQVKSLKYGYISQPFATTAAMISRTAVACTLLTSFGTNGKKTRLTILTCIIAQTVVSIISVLQTVLQCGPFPYLPTNRLKYFHYMWDTIPADDSVKCQSFSVQTNIGYIQGGLNAVVDFCLAAIVVADLWRVSSHVFRQHSGMSMCSRLRRLHNTLRFGQLWLILALSGPLVLSGAASIVKTYQFKAFKSGSDFSSDVVDYVLWTKVENYTLILASCAPIAQLFLRALIDHHEDQCTTHGSKSSKSQNKLAMQRHARTRSVDTGINANCRRTTWAPQYSQRYESRVSQASLPPQILDGFVTVKTDIVVEVDKKRPKSRSSKSWFLRDTESPKDVEARLERGV